MLFYSKLGGKLWLVAMNEVLKGCKALNCVFVKEALPIYPLFPLEGLAGKR